MSRHLPRTARHPQSASRALAVLSCALALLAAQPWISGKAQEQRARTAAVAVDASRTTLATAEVLPREIRTAAAAVSRREIARAEAEAHIHATWAMLRQILVGELTRMAPSATWFDTLDAANFAPVTAAVVAAQPARTASPEPRNQPLPLSHESAFVITRCLLAPPVVRA